MVDGGDEVFAGYRTYNQGLRMQHWYNKRYLNLPLTVLSKLTHSEKASYLAGVMKKDPVTLASALYRNMGFSQGALKELLNETSFYEAPKREHEQAILKALDETDDVFDVLLIFISLSRRNDNVCKSLLNSFIFIGLVDAKNGNLIWLNFFELQDSLLGSIFKTGEDKKIDTDHLNKVIQGVLKEIKISE